MSLRLMDLGIKKSKMKKNKFIVLLMIGLHNLTIAQQKVGIVTGAPTEKLHVAGNVKADTMKPNVLKITSGAGVGKILTSDAAGNAGWQNNNPTAAGNVGFGVWGDCATNANITEYYPVVDTGGNLFDLFGWSVAISGNYAIVGAKDDDPASDIFSKDGSATIFEYNGAGWVPIQKLTDSVSERFDLFGHSVSISGNYAVVGIPGDDTSKGSANIYENIGTAWVLMQKLSAANGDPLNNFGFSVSIADNMIIVGSYSDDIGPNVNQGSANIYRFNGNRWVLMQKITDASGASNDHFGASVSISGNYAVVGAALDDVGTNIDQGSVSIYEYDSSNWILKQKLTDATGNAGDNFGNSISISGNYFIAGAYLDDVGINSGQGAAVIYALKNESWGLIQKLTEATGKANDNFGNNVSLSGDHAIVGAYPGTIPTGNKGFSNIYVRVGNAFGKLQYISDPMGNSTDAFGHATAIDGASKRFVISAINYASGSGKSVFGKIN